MRLSTRWYSVEGAGQSSVYRRASSEPTLLDPVAKTGMLHGAWWCMEGACRIASAAEAGSGAGKMGESDDLVRQKLMRGKEAV